MGSSTCFCFERMAGIGLIGLEGILWRCGIIVRTQEIQACLVEGERSRRAEFDRGHVEPCSGVIDPRQVRSPISGRVPADRQCASGSSGGEKFFAFLALT